MTTITSTPKLTMKCKKLGINKDAIKESKNPVHVPSEKQVRRRTSFSKKILLTQERQKESCLNIRVSQQMCLKIGIYLKKFIKWGSKENPLTINYELN